MLTADGIRYAETVSSSYEREGEVLDGYLRYEKHTIPYDVVSLSLKRYTGKNP
jgi:hypothetical protein